MNYQALLEEIRKETIPAMLGNGQVDETYLLERGRKLEVLMNKILRLAVTSTLVRVILKPTVIGKKTLKPGNKIMVCVLISSS